MEDEIYRTSTQYRLWSFTPESLASLRVTTNSVAAEGVRAAVHSLRLRKIDGFQENDAQNGNGEEEVDCLTVEEEQKLLGWYCLKTIEFVDFCEYSTNVKVTAQLISNLSRR